MPRLCRALPFQTRLWSLYAIVYALQTPVTIESALVEHSSTVPYQGQATIKSSPPSLAITTLRTIRCWLRTFDNTVTYTRKPGKLSLFQEITWKTPQSKNWYAWTYFLYRHVTSGTVYVWHTVIRTPLVIWTIPITYVSAWMLRQRL